MNRGPISIAYLVEGPLNDRKIYTLFGVQLSLGAVVVDRRFVAKMFFGL